MTIHDRGSGNNPDDARRKFIDAMRKHGLELPAHEAVIADGEFHRCDVTGKGKSGTGDASYMLNLHGSTPFGWFRNWTTGNAQSWRYHMDKDLPTAEQRELDEAIKKAHIEHDDRCAEARAKAKKLWGDAKEAPAWHPYCEAKQVEPHGLRMFRFKDGDRALLVPMYGEDRKLQNLQFIYEDGHKRYSKGGRALDCHYWIAAPEEDDRTICICEGWATGESIASSGYAVCMTFGTNNLLSVAKWLQKHHPKHRIVICADDDWKTEGNPGVSSAHRAARAVDGLVAVPVFGDERGDKDTDFNDMMISSGVEAVRSAIDDAAEPKDEEKQDDEEPQHRGAKQADVLISLASDASLFHNDGNGYADLNIDGHRESWSIRSKGFNEWLLHQYYKQEGTAPSREGLRLAIDTIGARARFGAVRREVYVRIGGYAGKIYLDLCDPEWRVVEISPNGWRVISDAPVRFRRASGMEPLPMPIKGGSITDLRSFVNVAEKSSFVLLISWLVAALRDRGPYPGLALTGGEGSAKSTLVRALCRLIDPRKVRERRSPREDRDLFIAANNAYVIALGNVSTIPEWLSDSLCSLMTGGGWATRALYTDQDEVLFDAMRPVILNGIEFVTRSDLADRLIFLKLPPIKDQDRRTEQELWEAFDQKRPLILGALLDAVAHGLRALPDTPRENHPRMADFAHWATACEGALWDAGTFTDAYARNRDSANLDVIDGDTVAHAVLRLMEIVREDEQAEWTGTATELLNRLEVIVGEKESRRRHWPGSAPALGARLKRIAPRLAKLGVKVEHERDGAKRTITIALTKPFKGKASAVIPVTPVTTARQQRASDDSAWSDAGSERSDAVRRRTLKYKGHDTNDSDDSRLPPPAGRVKRRFEYRVNSAKRERIIKERAGR